MQLPRVAVSLGLKAAFCTNERRYEQTSDEYHVAHESQRIFMTGKHLDEESRVHVHPRHIGVPASPGKAFRPRFCVLSGTESLLSMLFVFVCTLHNAVMQGSFRSTRGE